MPILASSSLLSISKTLLFLWLVSTCVSCSDQPHAWSAKQKAKINFDWENIADDGLYGAEDGKVYIDYEFCIPDTEEHVNKLKQIDATIQLMRGSKGRINCSANEILCIASSSAENWKDKLRQITQWEVVEKIEATHWE